MAAGASRSAPPASFHLPEDIALAIVFLLEIRDVCSLASCCRFWRDICASDCAWVQLHRRRWPASAGDPASCSSPAGDHDIPVTGEHSSDAEEQSGPAEGWKDLYIKNHRKVAARFSNVIMYVYKWSEENESIEVGYYLKAIRYMHSMKFGFEDVLLFLFTAKHGVLLNLLGLHYSITLLKIPPKDVMKALSNCQISERKVCVSWFKLGRWFYGFRLPDEHGSRKVSLGELTMADEEDVLAVLNRGAVHEVLRVQITSVTPNTHWLQQ